MAQAMAHSTFLCIVGGLLWTLLLGTWVVSSIAPVALVWLGTRLIMQRRFHAITLSAAGTLVLSLGAPYMPTLPRDMRDSIGTALRAWFPTVERHYCQLPDRGLYCMHPHGVFSIGHILFMFDLASDSKEAIHALSAPFLSTIAPLAVMLAKLMNVKLTSAKSGKIQELMKQDHTLVLVPGGFHEISLVSSSAERVYLKDRTGFIALALRYGYTLIPVYSLGENDTYRCIEGLETWRFRLNDWNIPVVAFWGFPLCPIIPRRVPLTLTVGPPIPMPCIESNRVNVALHHERYVTALRQAVRFYGKELEVW